MSDVTRASRSLAAALVHAAAAEGRIGTVDKDLRLAAIERAGSQQELDLLVHDLKVAPTTYQTYQPGVGATVEGGEPDVVTSQPSAARTRTPVAALVVAALTIGGIGGVSMLVANQGDGDSSSSSSGWTITTSRSTTETHTFTETDQSPTAPDVLSPRGFRALLAALKAETGSTEVFSAVLYPDYASIETPVDATSKRSERWRWDGELTSSGAKSTAQFERVDLHRLKPALFNRLLRKVRAAVENPTSGYVVIHDIPLLDGPLMLIASNEFNETAVVRARLDGTVVQFTKP